MQKIKLHILFLSFFFFNLTNSLYAIGWQKKTAPIMTTWSQTIDTLNVLGEYPRPQFARSEWMNLNGVWDYKKSNAYGAYKANETFNQRILVPFPVESALSGIMDTDFKTSTNVHFYRRFFTIPESMKGKNILIHFGAVDWKCVVYINGHSLGTHMGGYDPFTYDITSYLTASGPQEIQVKVSDPGSYGGQPHGKQRNEPGGIWYTTSSGIWQTVWLEPVSKSYINDFDITPDLDKSQVKIAIKAKNILSNTQALIRVYDKGTLISTQPATVGTEVSITIPNAKFWSPESPFLYDLEFDLKNGDEVVDQVKSYFGMRKIGIGKINGTPCLLLNNKPYFQFGPLDQGYWPDGLYTAPSDEALKFDLIKTKEFGMNMSRKHIKVEPARWYYHCDTMGLLVWQDMPCAESGGTLGNITWQKNNFYREMKNVITSLKNSPCIVSWIPYNESWGQDGGTDSHTVKGVSEILTVDTTRLINPASGWINYELGDIVDRHYYPNPGIWPNLLKRRAAVCGEYGGISYVLDGHIWKGSVLVYTEVKSAEELTTRFIEYANQIKALQGNGLWGAVYTEITDVEEELNGLITYDRKVVKVDPAQMQRIKAVVQNSINKKLVPILPTALNDSTIEWKYATAFKAANWFSEKYDDASWAKGMGGFGAGSPPESSTRTPWTTSTIYLRKKVHIGNLSAEELQALKFLVYYDEGISVYINGILASTVTGFVSEYKTIEINALAKAAIRLNDDNLIAIKCSNTGGGQYIDLGLVTEVPMNSLVVDSSSPTSIVKNPIKGIEIYPNPTTGVFYLSTGAFSVKKVEVCDMTGRAIRIYKPQSSYEMKGIPCGLYILKVQTDNGMITSKILKK